MKYKKLRSEIIATVRMFNSTALSMGTSGNLSARAREGFLITPTGVPYEALCDEDLVLMKMYEDVSDNVRQASSEWRIHRDIYRHRPDINAIVHVHSPYATAIACTRQSIPAFHYEVAIAGGDSILCADYATFGTQQLADNAVNALHDRTACLLANHGQIALGNSVSAAFTMAQTVEVLAKQYTLSCSLGGPALLDDAEMKLNVEKFKHYGAKDD